MKNQYLYLLPFKGKPHFKFGVSVTSTYKRIKDLSSIYPLDFKNSIVVNSNHVGLVPLLEKQIKCEFRDFAVKDYKGKDGATEILSYDCFEEVLGLIENKIERGLSLEIAKGISFRKERRKPRKTSIDRFDNIDDWIIFYHRLNRYSNHIKKVSFINGDLYIRCKVDWFINLTHMGYLLETGVPAGRYWEDKMRVILEIKKKRHPHRTFDVFEDVLSANYGSHKLYNWRVGFSNVIDRVSNPRHILFGTKAGEDFIEYIQGLEEMVKLHPKFDSKFYPKY